MTAPDLIPVMWKITPEFMAKIWARTEPGPGDCILWTGPIDSQGYGHVSAYRATDGVHVGPCAHTVIYEATNGHGRLPGHEVDHTCHSGDLGCHGGPSCAHRRCINPAHLEQVTIRENRQRALRNHPCARKTHCNKGHEFTDENTYRFPSSPGHRYCKTCTRATNNAAYHARRAAA